MGQKWNLLILHNLPRNTKNIEKVTETPPRATTGGNNCILQLCLLLIQLYIKKTMIDGLHKTSKKSKVLEQTKCHIIIMQFMKPRGKFRNTKFYGSRKFNNINIITMNNIFTCVISYNRAAICIHMVTCMFYMWCNFQRCVYIIYKTCKSGFYTFLHMSSLTFCGQAGSG